MTGALHNNHTADHSVLEADNVPELDSPQVSTEAILHKSGRPLKRGDKYSSTYIFTITRM